MAYSRIMLKLSGEALCGEADQRLDPQALQHVVREVSEVVESNVRVALVVGAGNLFRGDELASNRRGHQISRVTADQIGMLGTVINALACRDRLESNGLRTRLFTPHAINGVSEAFHVSHARDAYDAGVITICAGGTGNPLFTTDTAACLRAIELGSEVVLKATQVDGVYDVDPKTHKIAKKFDEISYDEVIQRNLGVMDLSAIALCRDHKMRIIVYKLTQIGALAELVNGSKLGTLVQ